MEYTFVLTEAPSDKKYWALKITNQQQLEAYHNRVDKEIFYKIINNFSFGKEFNKDSVHHSPYLGLVDFCYSLTYMSNNFHITIQEAYETLQRESFEHQLKLLNDGYYILINSNLGYRAIEKDNIFRQFTKRETLDFPRYNNNDIRISKFPGGNHYYAYVDDIQVFDGDAYKWNSYDQAYDAASKIVLSSINSSSHYL